MSPRTRFLSTLVVGLLAMTGTANAGYSLTTPAPGSTTAANQVRTNWTGECDAGFSCAPTSFRAVYSQKADVDGTGRLVEYPRTEATDPYEVAYPGNPAAGTVLSPTLDPALWYVQLQWRQCDASYNCADVQTAPTTFRLAHRLVRPMLRITARYRYIRQVDYRIEFTGNAPRYVVRGVVSVLKRRANGRAYWAPVSRTPRKVTHGQYGRSRIYLNWKAGRVRTGTRVRFQGLVTAPGMRARTITAFTTAP